MGEFARGEEGRELCQFRVEAVNFSINSKGLGGREEVYVTFSWGANGEWSGALPTHLNLPVFLRSCYDGLQVFKGFHMFLLEERGCNAETKISNDFWSL